MARRRRSGDGEGEGQHAGVWGQALEMESWGRPGDLCLFFSVSKGLTDRTRGAVFISAAHAFVNFPHSLKREQGDNIPFI